MSIVPPMKDIPGIAVQVADGVVTYPDAATFTMDAHNRLLILDPAGSTVATFEAGTWGGVTRMDLPSD